MAQKSDFRSFALARVAIPDGAFIHPNTTSLTYKTALANNGAGLRLDLLYQYGITGKFGLSQNWSLDIPLVVDNRTLTINGRTYLVDFEWSDASGYASGLRYINKANVSFRQISPPENLPSGHGTYGYQLDQPDGSSVYFDVHGQPLEEHQADGSYVQYIFSGGEEAAGPLLESIQHSSGASIKVTNGDSQMTVALDAGNATKVYFTEDGVHSVLSVDGLSTYFDYVPFSGNSRTKILSGITYPTGLVSRYEYGAEEFLDATRSSQYWPKIQDFYQMDQDGTIHQHISYDLGGYSGGNTFTGAAIGLEMAGDTDTLMDGDGKALSYVYDVSESTYDIEENITARTTTSFNNYHLPVEVIQHEFTSSGDAEPDWRVTYSYDTAEERARTTNYEHPVSIEVSDYQGDDNWVPRAGLSEAKYQEYLNEAASYVW